MSDMPLSAAAPHPHSLMAPWSPIRARQYTFQLTCRGMAPINMQLHLDLLGIRRARVRRLS